MMMTTMSVPDNNFWIHHLIFNLDIWHAGSSSPYLGQVRRSRSQVKVHSHTIEMFLFSAMDACDDVKDFWSFVDFFVLKWWVRPRVRAF